MKRKVVALLLVLSMVLSMIPMNLFAARGNISPILPTAPNVVRTFDVRINAADLAGRTAAQGDASALSIQFRLEGGDVGNTHFARPLYTLGRTEIAVPSPGDVVTNIDGYNATRRILGYVEDAIEYARRVVVASSTPAAVSHAEDIVALVRLADNVSLTSNNTRALALASSANIFLRAIADNVSGWNPTRAELLEMADAFVTEAEGLNPTGATATVVQSVRDAIVVVGNYLNPASNVTRDNALTAVTAAATALATGVTTIENELLTSRTAYAFGFAQGNVLGLDNNTTFLTGPGQMPWVTTRTGREARVLLQHTGGVVPATASGFIMFTVPIYVGHNDARLVVELVDVGGNVITTLADQHLIAGQGLRAGVNVTLDGDPITFESVATLGDILITETNLGGDLNGNGNVSIRLTAPRDYTWLTTPIPGFGEQVNASIRSRHGVIDVARPNAFSDATMELQSAANPNVLIINYEVLPQTGAVSRNEFVANNILDTLIISNLLLVPNDRAPRTGNVLISVEIGTFGNEPIEENAPNAGIRNNGRSVGSGLVVPLRHADNVGEFIHQGFSNANRDRGYSRRMNFIAAIRTPSGIELEGPGSITELTSGQFADGWLQGGYHTIILRELVPNALLTGIATSIDFIAPAGVFITSAEYRVRGGSDDPHAHNWQSFEFTAAGVAGVMPTSGLGAVGSNTARLHLTPRTTSTAIRRIEVRFQLSVEAGFVDRHGTDSISIRVESPAVVGNVEVATVVDPIMVEGITPVRVGTGGIFNVIDPSPIGNITIHEMEPGFFEAGDEIWVYVVGTQLGRPVGFSWADVMLETSLNPITNTEESNFTLNTGYIRSINVGGRMVDAFVFSVRNPSFDAPATITLTNSMIFGNIAPGVDYQLVVTGPTIAENSHLVFAANYSGDSRRSDPNYALAEERGLFSSLPYSTEVVTFGYITDDAAPVHPPTVLPPVLPGLPVVREVWLNQLLPFELQDGGTITPPVFFETAPATAGGTVGVGYVALRPFAELIDADILLDTPQQGQVTIRGMDTTGRVVYVTVQTGNSFIALNIGGVPMLEDIATFSGAATGAVAGSLTVINRYDRLYLPFRAVANAFGYNLRTEGDFIVFG